MHLKYKSFSLEKISISKHLSGCSNPGHSTNSVIDGTSGAYLILVPELAYTGHIQRADKS